MGSLPIPIGALPLWYIILIACPVTFNPYYATS
jgi:hypothetical protein